MIEWCYLVGADGDLNQLEDELMMMALGDTTDAIMELLETLSCWIPRVR